MRFWFFILILISPTFVQGQNIAENKYRAVFKWTPSSLLTPETPTMQFGLELMPLPFDKYKLSLEYDFGFRYVLGTNYTEGVSNQHYTKSRLELRYYYTPLNKTINSFVAFEGFYVPYNYVQKDGAYHGIDGSAYIFDVAHVKRDIKGFDVKIGCVLKFKFPLLVEGFVGLGFRNVNLVYSDFTNRKLDTSQHWIVFATPPSEGEQTKLHVALGVKIGYRIF